MALEKNSLCEWFLPTFHDVELKLPRKALVAGGAGFLESHLCRRMLKEVLFRLEDWIAVAGKVGRPDFKCTTRDEIGR